MTLAEFRTYINTTFTANGNGGIDGSELQSAFLEVCNRIEAEGSWQPVFALVQNGPNTVLKVTNWTGGQGVKPPVNVYLTATGYDTNIAAAVDLRGPQGLPGLPGNGVLEVGTTPSDGLGSRLYKVLELAPDSGGSRPMARIELLAKPWDNTVRPGLQVQLYISSRGGFRYRYTAIGPLGGEVVLFAFSQTDGRIILYLYANDNFNSISVRVTDSVQATVVSALVPQTNTTGTLVFDSSQPLVYKPLFHQDEQFTTFFPRNNAGVNSAFFQNAPGDAALAVGANLTQGLSDLGFVSLGYAGEGNSGFSFWQQLSGTVRRLLLYMRADGHVGIGPAMTAPGEMLDVDGRVRTKGIATNGSMPTVAKGPALGNSGVCALQTNSTDMAGGVNLLASSDTTANAVLASVTFSTAYSRAPRILISPSSVQAANHMGRVFAVATANGFTLQSGVTAVDNSVFMEFSYLIIA